MSEVRRITRHDGTRVLAARDNPSHVVIQALDEGGFDLLSLSGSNWTDFEFLSP
jgi:hypothetical protein